MIILSKNIKEKEDYTHKLHNFISKNSGVVNELALDRGMAADQARMAARRQGGSQGRLAGKSRDAGVAASQLQSTIQQAQVMGQFEQENQLKKEQGEQALSDTMLKIAQSQKDEDDRYRNLVADLSTNFAQLGSIQK